MKKILITIIAFISALNVNASNEVKKVFISQVVEHPALDITTKGVIDGLEKNGFKRGVNLEIRLESAQANSALAAQIASKFINQNPDIVVGVGTITAQSFIKSARENKLKLIFATVTDPIGASLVEDLDKPGENISGVSNYVDLEPQIRLFQKLQPGLKRLGILYNPGEVNSITIVKRLEGLCDNFGIELVRQTACKTADVAQGATKLASQVDAIFISNDNTALGALQSIIGAANKVKIPVYVSDTDAVKLGALAALGPNQYEVGLQAGIMIANLLKGVDLSQMKVEFPKKTDLYINEKVAAVLGIVIPEDLKSKAIIISGYKA